MFSKMKLIAISCFVYWTLLSTGWTQRQLQDTFWLDKIWTNSFTLVNGSPGYGIAVDRSNRCYVANGSAIFVYDSTGTVLTNWTVPSARDVYFDPLSKTPIAVFSGNLLLWLI